MVHLGVVLRVVICASSFAAALATALPGTARSEADPPDPEVLAEIGELQGEMIREREQGDLEEAIDIAERRLELLRDTYGDHHVQVTAAAQELADLHRRAGRHERALEKLERLVAALEEADSPTENLARALDMLAGAHQQRQAYREAEAAHERALDVRRELHGDRSDEVARGLGRYGHFLWSRHAYAAAERAFLRAYCILLEAHGIESPELATPLTGLARLHALRGEEDRARLYLRALRRAAQRDERYPGERIHSLSSAASAYRRSGFEEEAAALELEIADHYREEIEALERERGETARELVRPLSALGAVLQSAERWEDAAATYRRLVAIAREHHGDNPLQSAGQKQALAVALQLAGEHAEAAELLEDVARLYREQNLGASAVAVDMFLAESYRQMGEYDEARARLTAAARAYGDDFGPDHPNVASALERRGVAAYAQEAFEDALDDFERAFEIHEPHIQLILAAGTEADNREYFRQIEHHLDLAVTLNARDLPDSARAARVAYTTVLRRKGRVLDAAADALDRVREELGEEGKDLLDELSEARAELASLIVSGPEEMGEEAYRRQRSRLESEVRRLERTVRERSAAFREKARPIDFERVRARIPEGAALVEIAAYRPARPRAPRGEELSEAERYAAYVVTEEGPPEAVDLGSAARVDEAVDRFRRALADPRGDAKTPGRRLYELVFAPLEPALGPRREVLLAPDAALNLIPFGALVDESDRHLLRRFNFTYLPSGRDLLRLGEGERAGGRPAIIADPTFDRAAGDGAEESPETPRTRGAIAPDFDLTSWQRLPGTAAEADALVGELDDPRVFRGERATETAIKEIERPSILHVATHGFFLEEPAAGGGDPLAGEDPRGGDDPLSPRGESPGAAGATDAAGADTARANDDSWGPDHPLLRSGLVFAGVNQLQSGRDDGVLTALEAAGLDLRGTQLVVLSACETGVGEAVRGDGVHGLRRAFVLAGAETTVMSLWQIDDEATRQLIASYYARLRDGAGRSEALRDVKLQMLRSDRYQHPYYWASFLAAGDGSPLAE